MQSEYLMDQPCLKENKGDGVCGSEHATRETQNYSMGFSVPVDSLHTPECEQRLRSLVVGGRCEQDALHSTSFKHSKKKKGSIIAAAYRFTCPLDPAARL